MAVVFTSHGYDTTSTNPYTETAWADAFPSIGLASYGVRSPLDWKVTPVAGQDRTVSIGAGWGFGHGVTDSTYQNDTIQLDTIGSGSRWDMIAVRRDWTPTAGVTKFVKVNGGATAVIPGGRQANPGGIDDQPLALVQVTAGQTQPTAIIDLRTWSGDGGGLIGAHDLVRTFLNRTGTRISIGDIDWLRRVGANDTPEWIKVGGVSHAEFTAGPTTAGSNTVWGLGNFAADTTKTTDTSIVTPNGLDTLRVAADGLYSVTVLVSFTVPISGVSWLSVDGNYTVTMGGGLQNFIATLPNVMLSAGQIINPTLAHGSGSTRTYTSRVRISKLA